MGNNIKTILIVDDNPANLGVLFDCLNHAGFKTLVAQDGIDALEMASLSRPDLILLDVIMPQMDGFTTCKALKRKPETEDIPVIFMTALSDTSDKITGFQCGAIDYICKPFQQEEVLARIHTHLTIQEQKMELLQINREKEKMLSVVAHDLKDPFQAMFGFLELLSSYYDSYTDEERKNYIQYVMDSTEKLHQLVENLLDWVRTGADNLDCKPVVVSVSDLADSALSMAQNMADNKGINITADVDSDVVVFGDANMIAAVMRNLVSNAVKFTPEKGSVTITSESSETEVMIRVQDSGVGISPLQAARLMTGGGHISTPGTANEKGTGMGLMICREFVEKNGGSIHLDSTPGQGTCFIVQLSKPPAV